MLQRTSDLFELTVTWCSFRRFFKLCLHKYVAAFSFGFCLTKFSKLCFCVENTQKFIKTRVVLTKENFLR